MRQVAERSWSAMLPLASTSSSTRQGTSSPREKCSSFWGRPFS